MQKRSLSCLMLIFLLCISCTAYAEKTPEDRARTFVEQLHHAEFKLAFAQFNDAMKKGLPIPMLESAWQTTLVQAGAFKAIKFTALRSNPGSLVRTVIVRTQFERADLDIVVSIEPGGKLAGLYFRPVA